MLEIPKEFPNKTNLERSHWFAVVVWEANLCQKRNGSLELLFSQESHDTDHGQSSVVNFCNQSAGLGLCAFVFGDAEGVVQVKGDRVGDNTALVEIGEFSWDSATHVVGSGHFGKHFQETNEQDNLPFGSLGKSIPELRGVVT